MRILNMKKKKLGTLVSAACLGVLAVPSVFASSSGVDLNLSAKAAGGGRAGAAYTRPTGPSEALFGNPATLTQIKGTQASISATFIFYEIEHEVSYAGLSTISDSGHKDLVVPDMAITSEVMPGLVLGFGVETDAGLAADYRTAPINILANAEAALGFTEPFNVPLMVELISFNANIGAGYQITDTLSIGAAVTIGFGLAQLGTVGDTEGHVALDTVAGIVLGTPAATFQDFGGTSSSVHNFGFGASLGLTWQPNDMITVGAAYKSSLAYDFEDILYRDLSRLGGETGLQDLKVELPYEVIVGVAFQDLLPNLLLEADLVYKGWGSAESFQDVWDDQYLLLLGAEYEMGNWTLRAGYSYSENMMKSKVNNTLSDLDGLGDLPLGDSPVPGFSTDLVGIVQSTLLPVVWEHNVSVGVGYDFGSFQTNMFVSYAFEEETSYTANTIGAMVGEVVPGLGNPTYTGTVEAQIFVGIGVSAKF
ncbi:MAG: outer membrane protein transport protein [Proteobacteria bacterium]|nr:outer membrane protein transport protein [Pseudomonadota bacterium]